MIKVTTLSKAAVLMFISLLLPCVSHAQDFMLKSGDKVTTDDGIYIVSGNNLITNPEFNDGLSGWMGGDGNTLSTDNFEIEPTGGPDGSACLHRTADGGGSSTNKTIRTGWPLTVGKTYVFSCWATRGSSVDGNARYSQVSQSSVQTTYDNSKWLANVNYVAGKWSQTEVVFTATDPYLVINFAWLSATTRFDCFFLGEVTKSNEVTTTKLENAITDAQNLLSSTTEGNQRGQYPTAAREVLQAAITTAQASLKATTQDEINAAEQTLQTAMSTYRNAVVKPFKVGVGYTLTNVAAGISLTTGSGTVQIATSNPADSTQVFYFVPAPEGAKASGYNLRDANGTYIYRSGSWDTKSSTSTDLTAANAIFNIVDYGSYVQIRNEGSGSVLGVDNKSNGSAVYSNKNGQSANNNWIIVRHSPTALLEQAISEAKKLLDATEVGNDYWQVPQSAADALRQAVSDAQSAMTAITTFEEGQEAVAALDSAVAKFNGSFNPVPEFDASTQYVITHYSGNVLTATVSGNASITSKAANGASDNQLMMFEKVNYQNLNNVYRIRSVSDATCLTRVGTWDTEWMKADTVAQYVQIKHLEGHYLGIEFVTTQTYLGADGTTSGSLLYSDKSGQGNTGAYWTIAQNITVNLDRNAFNAALDSANTIVNKMVAGYKKGQYFQKDIDEFKTVIATAKSNAAKASSQQELDSITEKLLTEIADYVKKAHSENLINKTDLTAAIDKADNLLKNAVAGDCDGQYPQTAIDALTKADAEAKNVLVDDNATQTVIDSVCKNLIAATSTFANACVKIQYDVLRAEITEAQQKLTETKNFIGDGPGKYPQSAYDALQDAITYAQQIIKDNKCNQDSVNRAAESLKKSIEEFGKSLVPNDYTELQALVDEAKKLLDEAAGSGATNEAIADLQASYDKNCKALTSTDQDEIDKATKILSRDIRIYLNDLASGVTAVALNHLAINVHNGQLNIDNLSAGARVSVYSLNGTLVSRQIPCTVSNGVYTILVWAKGKTVVQKIMVK